MSSARKQQSAPQNMLEFSVIPAGGKKYHNLCKRFAIVRKTITNWVGREGEEAYYCEHCKLIIYPYPAWEARCIDFSKVQKGKR